MNRHQNQVLIVLVLIISAVLSNVYDILVQKELPAGRPFKTQELKLGQQQLSTYGISLWIKINQQVDQSQQVVTGDSKLLSIYLLKQLEIQIKYLGGGDKQMQVIYQQGQIQVVCNQEQIQFDKWTYLFLYVDLRISKSYFKLYVEGISPSNTKIDQSMFQKVEQTQKNFLKEFPQVSGQSIQSIHNCPVSICYIDNVKYFINLNSVTYTNNFKDLMYQKAYNILLVYSIIDIVTYNNQFIVKGTSSIQFKNIQNTTNDTNNNIEFSGDSYITYSTGNNTPNSYIFSTWIKPKVTTTNQRQYLLYIGDNTEKISQTQIYSEVDTPSFSKQCLLNQQYYSQSIILETNIDDKSINISTLSGNIVLYQSDQQELNKRCLVGIWCQLILQYSVIPFNDGISIAYIQLIYIQNNFYVHIDPININTLKPNSNVKIYTCNNNKNNQQAYIRIGGKPSELSSTVSSSNFIGIMKYIKIYSGSSMIRSDLYLYLEIPCKLFVGDLTQITLRNKSNYNASKYDCILCKQYNYYYNDIGLCSSTCHKPHEEIKGVCQSCWRDVCPLKKAQPKFTKNIRDPKKITISFDRNLDFRLPLREYIQLKIIDIDEYNSRKQGCSDCPNCSDQCRNYIYSIEKRSNQQLVINFEFKVDARDRILLLKFSEQNILYDEYNLPIDTQSQFRQKIHNQIMSDLDKEQDTIANSIKYVLYSVMIISLVCGLILILINESTRFWLLWEYFQLYNFILFVSIDISDQSEKITKAFRLSNFYMMYSLLEKLTDDVYTGNNNYEETENSGYTSFAQHKMSPLFLGNADKCIQILLVTLLIMGISILLSKFSDFWNKIREIIEYNSILRIIIVTYTQISLATIFQIVKYNRPNNDMNSSTEITTEVTVNYILAWIFLFYMIGVLIYFYKKIKDNEAKFEEEDFIQEYGTLFEGYNLNGVANYTQVVKLLLRICYAVAVVYLQFDNNWLLFGLILITTIDITYNISIMPYNDQLNNYIAILLGSGMLVSLILIAILFAYEELEIHLTELLRLILGWIVALIQFLCSLITLVFIIHLLYLKRNVAITKVQKDIVSKRNSESNIIRQRRRQGTTSKSDFTQRLIIKQTPSHTEPKVKHFEMVTIKSDSQLNTPTPTTQPLGSITQLEQEPEEKSENPKETPKTIQKDNQQIIQKDKIEVLDEPVELTQAQPLPSSNALPRKSILKKTKYSALSKGKQD